MEIISAKILLTLVDEPLVGGAIAVENGEIIDVGSEQDLIARYPSAQLEDFPEGILMPGLINAHTHLDMSFHQEHPLDPVRSPVDRLNFVDWLLSCIEYKKNFKHERLRDAVKTGLSQCIEAGTTCVADMGSYEGVYQCLTESGLRGVIFPEVISYDSHIAQDLFETAMAIVEKYLDSDSELIGVGLAPYAPFTLSRNLLKIMAQYCWSSNIPLMMHTAESFSEMEFFYDSTGDIATKLFPNIGWGDDLPPAFRKSPIAYLDEIQFLGAKPVLAGCVQVAPTDLDRLAAKGAKVIWTPRSNDYLKLGVAPIAKMLAHKIPVALGTDGLSSNSTLSLWDEMNFAKKIAPELTSEIILRMATIEAAKIIGVSETTGSLQVGKKADYLIVNLNSDAKSVYDDLVTQGRDYRVQKVVVNGRTLKSIV